MSYDNAEPKILKTLNSSGQVLDDSGEVISDTSDYWVKVYNEAEPKVDKILYSDGTIKDSAGNLIQDTTAFNVKKYTQAEPIPAKYLHSDGTIDENPGSGSGADLEDNHQTTIDVSAYTEPVEIEPTAGKDGMKKVTVTLSDIPTGGSMSQTRPAWTNLGEYDISISGDVVVPDGVKVYYYNGGNGYVDSFVGDGVATLSGEFSAYTERIFVFIASCGDDIAMYFSGNQKEEEG